MENLNMSDTTIPSSKSTTKHKTYYCPHCKKLIMKGNVQRLSMTCPHCTELIDADEEKLLNFENNKK